MYNTNIPQQNILNTPQFQSGISQPPGLHPKKIIKIFGQEYILCKDASDPTTAFPHNRVKIQDGDCVHIKDSDIDVYFCYLHGIIQPLPNSLEKPVNVYYTGFHDHMIDLRYITPADVSRMHVYKVESTDWASQFVRSMLGAPSTSEQERTPISPFPPGFMNNVQKAANTQQVQQVQPQQVNSKKEVEQNNGQESE